MRTMIFAALLALSSNLALAEEKPTLHLTGTGVVTAEPDEGYIVVGVAAVAPTSVEALGKSTATMQKLYSRLAELGVQKKEIKTVEFSVGENITQVEAGTDRNGQPIYKTKRDGYIVANVIRVTVCDLKSFGEVLDAAVQDGANRVQSISFGSSKAIENLDKARAAAVKDAVRKAGILTGGLGVKLGTVKTVSEYGGRLREESGYMRSAANDAPGGAPISGGSLSFTVNVNVVWEVE